jgi:hypothetical protein
MVFVVKDFLIRDFGRIAVFDQVVHRGNPTELPPNPSGYGQVKPRGGHGTVREIIDSVCQPVPTEGE